MHKNNWYNYSDPVKRLLARLRAIEAELDVTTDEFRRQCLRNEMETILKELKNK